MSPDKLTNVLFLHWQRSLQLFRVESVAVQEAFARLVEAYSSSGRYYHTLEHIDHVLSTIQTLQNHTKDLATVQLAAWFHDAIYDSQANDNEEKSANYARELLQALGIPSSVIANVTRLIVNTKQHQAAVEDSDSQVLLDADLAILSSKPIQYWEYADKIRQEYAWVPETQYIEGRKQVLERFLQRNRIYFTVLMFNLAEASARSNLKAEIQFLQHQIPADAVKG
ncbi:MAG: hypothetical protein KME08_15290 [Aphanothece sp. CMT-3BRIN-NPC111]|jgi:predicted metal-dependent HD superfamily phosphohydrolase|nr:hypothetical protein [Aphanothece sp. CMT-3BRIN-NPC111]